MCKGYESVKNAPYVCMFLYINDYIKVSKFFHDRSLKQWNKKKYHILSGRQCKSTYRQMPLSFISSFASFQGFEQSTMWFLVLNFVHLDLSVISGACLFLLATTPGAKWLGKWLT